MNYFQVVFLLLFQIEVGKQDYTMFWWVWRANLNSHNIIYIRLLRDFKTNIILSIDCTTLELLPSELKYIELYLGYSYTPKTVNYLYVGVAAADEVPARYQGDPDLLALVDVMLQREHIVSRLGSRQILNWSPRLAFVFWPV